MFSGSKVRLCSSKYGISTGNASEKVLFGIENPVILSSIGSLAMEGCGSAAVTGDRGFADLTSLLRSATT